MPMAGAEPPDAQANRNACLGRRIENKNTSGLIPARSKQNPPIGASKPQFPAPKVRTCAASG
jgi:hypothetical protein